MRYMFSSHCKEVAYICPFTRLAVEEDEFFSSCREIAIACCKLIKENELIPYVGPDFNAVCSLICQQQA